MTKHRVKSKSPATSRSKSMRWIIAGVVVSAGVIAYGRFRAPPAASEDAGPLAASQKHAESTAGSPFAPTVQNQAPAPGSAPQGMVWIPGGEFSMGSDAASESLCSLPGVTRDALPIHRVYVDAFWMDATEVTNEQFERFVKATGYITVAEQKPTQEEFPNAPPENLVAGSTVFTSTPQPVQLNDFFQWWSYVPGADWRHPAGPESDLKGREKHPVVQIAYEDAAAYAKWAGKRLPTEAEWEFAARGGVTGGLYAWGNDLKPGGKFQANIYQGRFPVEGGDTGEDGFKGIAPVAQFQPNAYGLHDVAGNVWEWVSDVWMNPAPLGLKFGGEPRGILRGGASSYSPRQARASYQGFEALGATCHDVGFRCALDAIPRRK